MVIKKPGKFKVLRPASANVDLLVSKGIQHTQWLNVNDFEKKMSWGVWDSKNPHQYFDEDSVYVVNGNVHLASSLKPKSFGKHIAPYAIGLIESKQSYGRGIVSVELSLPSTFGTHAAVWLYNSCEEIDLLEAYNRSTRARYNNWLGIPNWMLETNFHFDNNKIKTKRHPVFFDVTKHKLEVTCWRTDGFVNIYYNGHLIRSKKTKDFARPMRLIINNGVLSGTPALSYSEVVVTNMLVGEV